MSTTWWNECRCCGKRPIPGGGGNPGGPGGGGDPPDPRFDPVRRYWAYKVVGNSKHGANFDHPDMGVRWVEYEIPAGNFQQDSYKYVRRRWTGAVTSFDINRASGITEVQKYRENTEWQSDLGDLYDWLQFTVDHFAVGWFDDAGNHHQRNSGPAGGVNGVIAQLTHPAPGDVIPAGKTGIGNGQTISQTKTGVQVGDFSVDPARRSKYLNVWEYDIPYGHHVITGGRLPASLEYNGNCASHDIDEKFHTEHCTHNGIKILYMSNYTCAELAALRPNAYPPPVGPPPPPGTYGNRPFSGLQASGDIIEMLFWSRVNGQQYDGMTVEFIQPADSPGDVCNVEYDGGTQIMTIKINNWETTPETIVNTINPDPQWPISCKIVFRKGQTNTLYADGHGAYLQGGSGISPSAGKALWILAGEEGKILLEWYHEEHWIKTRIFRNRIPNFGRQLIDGVWTRWPNRPQHPQEATEVAIVDEEFPIHPGTPPYYKAWGGVFQWEDTDVDPNELYYYWAVAYYHEGIESSVTWHATGAAIEP